MTALVRASELIGLPVVSIADGEDIAEVKDVVFAADGHGLSGFTLNKRGFWHGSRRELLPAEDVVAVGADAVMVASDEALRLPADSPAGLTHGAGRQRVIGARVLTVSGRDLGVITEVIVALGAHCEVVGYEIAPTDAERDSPGRLLPVDAQVALSAETLLVPDEIEAFMRDDLVGFGVAIEAFGHRSIGPAAPSTSGLASGPGDPPVPPAGSEQPAEVRS